MPKLRSWWPKIEQHRLLIIGIIVVLFALIAFTFAVFEFGWDWTGFIGYNKMTTATTTSGTSPATTTTITTEPQLGKTLWDWMQLLIIPVVLAIGGFWLNQIQKSREEEATKQRIEIERKAAERRAQTDREIAHDNQQEAALQSYIDKMSELLLKEHLGEAKPEYEGVRKIARVRTLTVLPRLDVIRKRSVLQFLQESGLIDKGKRIVDLRGAFLNGADLFEIDLSSTDLSRADLSRADLRGGNLRDADLTEATLTGVLLTGATLTEATLTEAYLIGATLQGANLTKATLIGTYLITATLQGANLTKATLTKAYLRGANLANADLTDADLTDADLTEATLTGATLTREQWEKAKLLHGVTLPDGSIHP